MTNDLGRFLNVGMTNPVHMDVTRYRVTFFVVTPHAIDVLHQLGLDDEFTQVNSAFAITGVEASILEQGDIKNRVCSELSYGVRGLIAEALAEKWGQADEH